MTTAPASATPRSVRIAAGVLTAIALLLAAMAAYILAVPVDENDFEATTGVAWDAFSTANPQVAGYLVREARVLAVVFLGFVLLVAAISWSRLRGADPRAPPVLWLFPATLWGSSVVFLAEGGVPLGGMYLLVGIVAAVALVVSRRDGG